MVDQRNGGIAWTDETWNPIRGCSRISPGCGGANHEGGCYAEKIAARFSNPGQPYEGYAKRNKNGGTWTGKLGLVEHMLEVPLRWTKPRRVFANSMSDLFHENLPDEAIDRIFVVMALAQQHTFQILTKRADRMRAYMNERWRVENIYEQWYSITGAPREMAAWPLPNVWLGVSVEDQTRADERIPHLLATPAAVRFLSCEPLLGPIDLRLPGIRQRDATSIDWVIVGGESGPRARPMHPDWARSLRDQCAASGVPFFFKQWGEFAPQGLASERWLLRPDGTCDPDPLPEGIGRHHKDGYCIMYRVGKRAAGRLLDGFEHSEFPT